MRFSIDATHEEMDTLVLNIEWRQAKTIKVEILSLTPEEAQEVLKKLLDSLSLEWNKGSESKVNHENSIIESEKKIAVLEYRVQEQQENMKILKNGLDTITEMLKDLKINPFGSSS